MEAKPEQPSPPSAGPAEKDIRVAEAISEYLDRLARGDTPDPRKVVEEHPEIAADLASELETLAAFDTAFEPDRFPLLQDFEILRELGRGGMGVVYEAWQKSLGRRVALKMLPPGLLADARAVARFQREARVVAKLHHLNIVSIYGMGIDSGVPYFTMEFVEGRTLDQVLRAEPQAFPGDPARLAEAFAGAAEGLQHAHVEGVTHRDLKPSNLIFDPDGRMRILDFGLARVEGQEQVTATGEFLGTLLYMSPEQIAGRAPLDPRSDIYSLGAALYQAMAGRPPFCGRSSSDTLRQILVRDPIPPRRWNERVPRDLETITLKCLRKSPGDRYSTAEALAQDLRRFARKDPIEARPQALVEAIARRAWRNKGRVAGVMAALLLVLTTGLLLAFYWSESRRGMRRRYEDKVTRAVLEMQLERPLPRGDRTGDAGRDLEEDPSSDPARHAVRTLEEAVQLLPEGAEARYHLARALRLIGRDEEAQAQLSRLIAHHPGFTPAVVLRAALLEQRHTGSGGEPGIIPPGVILDSWAQAWLKAHRSTLAGDWRAVADAYTEVAEAARDGTRAYLGWSAETHLGRGAARRMTGDFLGALEDYVTTQALWPEALEPGILIGEAYLLLGRKDRAEQAFERLHRKSRFQDATALRIARVLLDLREFDLCLAWTERVEEAGARQLARSDSLMHLRRLDDALDAARKAVELDPGSPRARNGLGHCLYELGRLDEAAEQFRRSIELDPSYARARNGLGLVLERQGDLEGAVRQFGEAVGADPRNAKARNNLGSVLHNLGRVDEGIDQFRAAVKLNPRYGKVRRNLATALEHKRMVKEAIEELRELLRFDPEDVEARHGIGRLLNSQHRYEDAVAELREVLQRDEGHASAHNNLAVALQALGRLKEAVPEYSRAFELEPRQPLFARNLKGALESLLASLPQRQEPVPGDREVLRQASEVLERAGRADPELLRTLAAMRALEKDFPAAVLALEDAVRLPGASRALLEELARHRRACLPDLVSFTSVDAALDESVAHVLIREGDPWSYHLGLAEPSPSLEWTLPAFDDSAWPRGPSGFGFGDGDDATVLDAMKGVTTTLHIRRAFQAPAGELRRLVLSVRADDGFVAYLNGVEVGRERAGKPGARVPANAVADGNAAEPLIPLALTLEPGHLQPGSNVVAIQGLNRSRDSSDFSLLPVLSSERAPGPQELGKRLDTFRAAGTAEEARGRLLYMEARVLQLEGRPVEAMEKLEAALAGAGAGASSPEAWIRLAECLRAAGRAGEAEARVRAVLADDLEPGAEAGARRDLWETWLQLALVDLKLSPAEALARFPAGGKNPRGRALDPRWLLERLATGEPLRINCGGGDYRDREGAVWSRDRFFTAGGRLENPRDSASERLMHIAVAGTKDEALYQCQRCFLDGTLAAPGYRLPVPSGRYRVVLGFAELFEQEARRRRFDVRLEGRTELEEFEPLSQGLATAGARAFEVEVRDGALDLELVRKAGNPCIASLAVEPVR